jgi:restriction endonuclease S subunit
MRKYNSYKDSGVEWLGSVPENWQLIRNKDIALINSTSLDNNTNPFYEFKYIDIGNVNQNGIINEPELISFSDSPSRARRIIKENDVIVSTVRTYLRAVAFINFNSQDFIVSTGFAVLSPYKIINPTYLAYYCQSDFFIDLVIKNSKGVSYPAINASELACLSILFPSDKEQTAIAQYLVSKTQAIDKKVNLLEKKIGYYKELRKSIINETVTKGLDKNVKLKDSGIKWIGQIPVHWEVKRFKDVVSKYTTGGTPSTSNNAYFNGDNIWITIGDIGESNLVSTSSLFLTDEAIKDANIVKTPKGSLLYSFKLSIGKMAFTTVDCYTNEAILSIFPNKNIDLMYYYMMLPTFMMLAATENIYGAKMLNQKLIANAFVLHPPKTEQTEIATYLDHKTQTIDKIVGNIQNQITTLKELHKTLINDVVTGKIKVVE